MLKNGIPDFMRDYDAVPDWSEGLSGLAHAMFSARPICHLTPYNTPGVYVDLDKAGPAPAEFTTFETLYVVGPALRGPVANKDLLPEEINSYEDFQAIYKGGPGSPAAATVRQWFNHGGIGSIRFTRAVGAGATQATADLDDDGGDAVIVLKSKGSGADYNGVAGPPALGLSATYDADTRILTIYDEGLFAESYEDVDFSQAAQIEQYVTNQSNLAILTWPDKTQNPITTVAPIQFAGGANGAAVTAAEIVGNEALKTGIYSFDWDENRLPLGFLTAPGFAQQTVGNALITMAERHWRVAGLHSTFGLTAEQIKTERNQWASPFGFAIYEAGWMQQPDPTQNNAPVWFPRIGARLAMISRSHARRNSLANVGAGIDYNYRDCIKMELDWVDDRAQADFNRRGINLARDFRTSGQGRVQWGARTLSTDVRFKFLHVPIISAVLATTLKRVLRLYVFGVIDGRDKGLAASVRATCEQACYELWRDGVLFGADPKQAFLVEVKATPLALENGILPVNVYFAPSAIAEIITVKLLRMSLGYNPTTGELNVNAIDLAPNTVL